MSISLFRDKELKKRTDKELDQTRWWKEKERVDRYMLFLSVNVF